MSKQLANMRRLQLSVKLILHDQNSVSLTELTMLRFFLVCLSVILIQ